MVLFSSSFFFLSSQKRPYPSVFLCLHFSLVCLKENSLCSGPSRFDWDWNAQAWIYRRTKANLLKVLESELEQLCGEPISLS